MRSYATVLLLIAVQGISGCGGSGVTAPTPTPTPPAQVQLAVFTDPGSSFSTSDIRDSLDQIVRFDTNSNSLIWVADGRSFTGFPVSGNFVRADKFFQVRFGTKDGQRRAYFTEAVATTLCRIEVVGGQVIITPTTVTVPGS
ncbi:MAG: hypothetical protein ABIS06_17850 [Vicinamibacterales bacterium]